MTRPAQSEVQKIYRVLSWIGIIDQLVVTRATRALADIGLPFPQFRLLSHFARRPNEPKTVGKVAAAMQQPQPGTTKTLQKMIGAGLLRVVPSKQDARSKPLFITAKGIRMLDRALETLTPVFRDAFAGWSEAELAVFLAQLDRLKVWMDTRGRE